MARMVKRCYGQRRFTERARFGAAVCGWQLRKRLRRIAHHYQRSVLVRRAKEEILKRRLEQFTAAGLVHRARPFAFALGVRAHWPRFLRRSAAAESLHAKS